MEFVVNNNVLLDPIDDRNRVKDIKEIVLDIYRKALRIQWEMNRELFHYQQNASEKHKQVPIADKFWAAFRPCMTRSDQSLQLCCKAKYYFRKVRTQSFHEDEPVSPGLLTKWETWLVSMQWLENLKFDHCVVPPDVIGGVFELYHSGDASLAGYRASVICVLSTEKAVIVVHCWLIRW